MTGLQRVQNTLKGIGSDRPPVLPILHSGLPNIFSTSLSEYYTNAECMADIIIKGYKLFGYDGVQLSLGVTGEAQALGAKICQPVEAGPILQNYLLDSIFDEKVDANKLMNLIRQVNPTAGGRMPLYYNAVCQVMDAIGKSGFVFGMLRGPLLIASQLCGVEPLLIGMIESPERVISVLEFTTGIAEHLAGWLISSGAHGLMLGEATCSPNFISPRLYRSIVLPFHRRLVKTCKLLGWESVGLHICGNISPIFNDIISTGVDLVDVDYQVPAEQAVLLARNRVCLRGNLDPSRIFRFGSSAEIVDGVTSLVRAISEYPRWIISSGCDIPPGTPASNIRTFMEAVNVNYTSNSTAANINHVTTG
jgi:uroporphyrinogen decarboxylase